MATTYLATLADVGAGIPSGTSFPGSPSTNDIFRRTDLGMVFYYNGTRWLSLTQYRHQMGGFHYDGSATSNIGANQSPYDRIGAPSLAGGSDLWIEQAVLKFFISGGGTALGASHKWVYQLDERGPGGNVGMATFTIDSGASSTFRELAVTVNALMNNGALKHVFEGTMTRTGTPGNFEGFAEVLYRVVAT